MEVIFQRVSSGSAQPRMGPGALGLLSSSSQASLTLELCLWSQAASTCFFRGENMQEVLALARSSMQKGFRTPGSLLVQLQARWLQATGRMTQVSRAGQTSWYSHPSRVMTVISSSVVIVPPPSEGGLARPGARARRDWQECGYLGLCLVARDAS